MVESLTGWAREGLAVLPLSGTGTTFFLRLTEQLCPSCLSLFYISFYQLILRQTCVCSSNFTIIFCAENQWKIKSHLVKIWLFSNRTLKWGFKIVVEGRGQKSLFQVFPVIVWVNVYDLFHFLQELQNYEFAMKGLMALWISASWCYLSRIQLNLHKMNRVKRLDMNWGPGRQIAMYELFHGNQITFHSWKNVLSLNILGQILFSFMHV